MGRNAQLELQKREFAHMEKMALYNAFARDPELKYFVGVAAGAASGAIGVMLAQTMSGDESPPDTPTEPEANVPWGWVLSGASPYTFPLAFLESMTLETASNSTGMFGFIPNILILGGSGFAGFCSMVLILKAIFGDEDVASLMQGVGTVADAAVPL